MGVPATIGAELTHGNDAETKKDGVECADILGRSVARAAHAFAQFVRIAPYLDDIRQAGKERRQREGRGELRHESELQSCVRIGVRIRTI